jgi:hypothetical protein
MARVHVTLGDISLSCQLREFMTSRVSKFLPKKSVEAGSHEGMQPIDLGFLRDLSRPLDQVEGAEVISSEDCHSGEVEDSGMEISRNLGASNF